MNFLKFYIKFCLEGNGFFLTFLWETKCWTLSSIEDQKKLNFKIWSFWQSRNGVRKEKMRKFLKRNGWLFSESVFLNDITRTALMQRLCHWWAKLLCGLSSINTSSKTFVVIIAYSNKMKLCTMSKTRVLLDLFVNLIGVYHLAGK